MTLSYIPFANPHAAYSLRKETIIEAVTRVLDSGNYILGPEVEYFEKNFADYLGLPVALGCANGTDALELSLRALGAGPGKAVFTVSHTAVATVAAIERAGATPVLVDVDPQTYTMSPDSLRSAIHEIKINHSHLCPLAVIPVHIYGHPCDMEAITAIARQYSLMVVEDCAQAHGARFKGKMVGTMGDIGAFSCYPTKNLGALGDAGVIALANQALAQEVRALRQYGWKDRYISAVSGINSRLDPIQAAILSIQLPFLDGDNQKRRAIASIYNTELISSDLVLPISAPWAEPVFHLYVVRSKNRQELMDFLGNKGIATAIHYPQPIHLQPAYRNKIMSAPQGLPVTEYLASQLLSLPMYPQLGEENAFRVCAAINEWHRLKG